MGHAKKYINGLIIMLFILSGCFATAQENLCHQPGNRALKLFNKGTKLWSTNPEKGKTLVMRAIDTDPQWPAPRYFMAKKYYKQAEIIQYDTRKVASLDRLLNRSSDYFEEVIKLCPSYEDYKSYYYLSKIYFDGNDLNGAYNWLKTYMKHVDKSEYLPNSQHMYDKCIAYKKLVNNPVKFNPKAVPGVCTSNDEFMPLIAPDGSYMLFTRKLWKQERGAYSPKMVEEFRISDFIRWDSLGNPVFDEADVMPYPFNKNSNQGAASITIDNKKIYITVCQQIKMPDGRPYKNCDIYVSSKSYDKWGELKRLNRKINGLTTWEGHPSVSPDGQKLYFASYRPGGKGGIDLYYSKKDSTGKWTSPVNLGAPVNTHLNERAPFIHPDNKTLYFASDGHAGVGGYDIFVSRKKDTLWQKPVNIGYPINSKKDESGFIVSTDGHYAFFSSNAYKGYGGYDILGFELYDDVQPDKVLFVKGKLVDGNGAVLRNASVEMQNIRTHKVKKGLVDNTTGKYAIAVAADTTDNYMMTIRKPDYAFTSKIISPDDTAVNNMKINVDFAVKEANVGANSRLNDVLFPFNSAKLTEMSKVMLDNFAQYLRNNPDIKIRIEGHTDNIADDQFNMKLSRKRAQRVFRYLVKKGIKRKRVSYKGYGETQPVAPNDTEKGRAKNRRTEFVITNK